MNPSHTPSPRERLTATTGAIIALAAGTYIACGDGFTWDPTAYTIAWLLLICALAATIPQADTLIDTTTRMIRSMVRILRRARHAHRALAGHRHTTGRMTRGVATTTVRTK
ncbi:hypothetical protein LF907_04800 [Bifidobacterium pseudolongum]|uniref:hypothetical protein n=1 Tax=Bifidobacterium pseudolongum TaxID=1694 RepID=UPI001F0E25A5|nr:hypothetical protein [Bifidobacterium pseudolongum]MCH4849928.1 hypothetical protein [Bifidobacterium pseudolongum]